MVVAYTRWTLQVFQISPYVRQPSQSWMQLIGISAVVAIGYMVSYLDVFFAILNWWACSGVTCSELIKSLHNLRSSSLVVDGWVACGL